MAVHCVASGQRVWVYRQQHNSSVALNWSPPPSRSSPATTRAELKVWENKGKDNNKENQPINKWQKWNTSRQYKEEEEKMHWEHQHLRALTLWQLSIWLAEPWEITLGFQLNVSVHDKRNCRRKQMPEVALILHHSSNTDIFKTSQPSATGNYESRCETVTAVLPPLLFIFDGQTQTNSYLLIWRVISCPARADMKNITVSG